ncbi:MAG: hypothetical protein PWR03_284 [Tenuifilum sp.]|jgi:uncharacterized protein (TIGR02453 family)|uniref:DUF2461 domain-containing protein n=1 Tax=Tenuifilum sp. TaxID=2760880 RepID=UPI0024AAA115|nr:DUF2461 domain-containing protein [Tenuifilum sp.]MDI3526101.1 hypothetical protein [Tenuifilum sp.]
MLNDKFVTFFTELERNNNRDWFNQNRKVYEKECLIPFKELVSELISRISLFDKTVSGQDVSSAIFRINRDIRFSKDKTPYNTELKAAIVKGGRKSLYPGYYLAIGAEKSYIGGGLYNLSSEMLEKIRDYIAEHPEKFKAITTDTTFVECHKMILGDKSKRLPAKYKELANSIPEIALKQFYYMSEIKTSQLINNKNIAETILTRYLAGYKLNYFLQKALSQSV